MTHRYGNQQPRGTADSHTFLAHYHLDRSASWPIGAYCARGSFKVPSLKKVYNVIAPLAEVDGTEFGRLGKPTDPKGKL